MAKLVLGSKEGQDSLTTIEAVNLLAHTIVLGQSGSGKSFFLARLLEEVLLRTKARIMVIDPNGDFETFFAPREPGFWNGSKGLGKVLSDIQRQQGAMQLPSFDSKHNFTEKWKEVIFQHLVSGKRDRMPLRDKVYGAPVKLHWKYIPRGIQDFLLEIDPLARPKVFQGVATCYHFVENNKTMYPSGVSLSDLEDISMLFESKQIASSLTVYPDAMTLSQSDWHSVRMQFRMIRKKFGDILYLNKIKGEPRGSQASDLGNYIHRGFVEGDDSRPPWNFLSVGLAGAISDHSLLSTYVALQRVWGEAVRAWREERSLAMEAVTKSALPTGKALGEFEALDEEGNAEDRVGEVSDVSDLPDLEDEPQYAKRRPTFIVVDEAHNFVPEEADSDLQKQVSDLIMTIAAEGRKYGLFLIVSTQRPQKLRKGLVAECENIAVMKLQSIVERKYLVSNTSLEEGNEQKVATFKSGDVLLSGRWSVDTTITRAAPARTFLGGTGISPEAWLE
jgi:Helicase HerA, central domain